jgi:hypothetical protein
MLRISLSFALDSATGWKRESMIKHRKYGTPDKDNPEWTKEMFARSMKFKDLPESLQRTLSKTGKMRGSFAPLKDDGEEQTTARTTANADSLRE